LPDELQGARMNDADRFNGKPVRDKAVSIGESSTASCGIAFMAKASAPGRAKTRLVPPLTYDQAADLNTAFLQDVADNLVLAGRGANGAAIVGYAAYGPPGSADFFRRILPRSIGLIEAWLPNFGDCLFRTIREILARGHDSAVVLNADSPTLPTAFLVETAEVLARPGDRAVLGPSRDGGYYLLGLKFAHRRMFEDIAWSTERVAEQSLARAREIGLNVHMLPAWYDVDDIDGLRRLQIELRESDSKTPPQNWAAPHQAVQTAKLLNELARDRDFGRLGARPLEIDEIHA
jgi:rSAM/selenodomain-associated transferase 1